MRGQGRVFKNIFLVPALLAVPLVFAANLSFAPFSKQLTIIGEEHGRPDLKDEYERLIRAFGEEKQKNLCLFLELDGATQAAFDEFHKGKIAATQVLTKGVQATFEKWRLTGPNELFDWQRSVELTVENFNLEARHFEIAQEKGIRIVAVDRQSRQDYLATVYQILVERGSVAAAREGFVKGKLLEELPASPDDYFRDEIILRRSRDMSDNIAAAFDSGKCQKGLFIVGSLHASKAGAAGTDIYRQGGLTIPELLRYRGISSRVVLVGSAPSLIF